MSKIKNKAGLQNNIVAIICLQTFIFILSIIILIVSVVVEDIYSIKIAVYVCFSAHGAAGLITVYLLVQFINDEKDKKELYDRVTLFVPGGFVDFKIGDALQIITCNEKLMRHLGYSDSQFREEAGQSFVNLIVPEDRKRIIDAINSHIGERSVQLSFRIKCKGNSSVPVLAICSYYRMNTVKKSFSDDAVHCLIIDSSSLKKMADERTLDTERYKIIAEQSDSIIFDYNVKDKLLYINPNFEKKFGYTLPQTTNVFSFLVDNAVIHPEDHSLVINTLKKLSGYDELEARIKKSDMQYIWCKMNITTIFDERGRDTRVIGKITDIDAQNRRTAQLIESAQRDLMTGLYNKQTTENLVSEALKNNRDSLCAMFVMDVDNFKVINDECGHSVGDAVLSRIAENVKQTFRSSDILGRVGGDEFVMFLKDLPSEKHAVKKAGAVLSIIRNIKVSNEETNIKLSASLGISFYTPGETYREMFEKADKAMYISKRLTKNAFTVYDKSLEE